MPAAPSDAETHEAFIVLAQNGEMDMDTLGVALRSLGWNPSSDEVQELFYQADEDGSGSVDHNEFMNIVHKYSAAPRVTAEDVRSAFRNFDAENQGFISTEEVRYMMKNLGEGLSDHELDDLIRAVDADGNGKVDMEEFVALLN